MTLPVRTVLAYIMLLALPAGAGAVPTVQPHTTIVSPVQLGPAVPLGDVNGDGLEDLGLSEDAFCATRAWVVFGSASPATLNLGDLGGRGLSLSGLGSGLCGNVGLSPAGDVNGDGRDDVAIDAGRGGEHWLRIVYGRSGGGGLDVGTPGANGWLLRPTAAADLESIRGVGDVNGDGRDDIAVSYFTREGDTASGRREGAATVVFGQGGARTVDVADPSVPGLRLLTTGDARDATLTALPFGDLTGDGRADLLTTLDGWGPTRLDLHAGRPASATIDLAHLDGMSLALGELTGNLWRGLGVLGDLDGDGLQDYRVEFGESKPVASLSSRLSGPLSDAGLIAGGLEFLSTTSLPAPDVVGAGELTGDGRADLAAPAASGHLQTGASEFVTRRPLPRRWSFLVPGTTSPRRVDLEAPSGGTARLDSMPDGFVMETGLAFASRPGQAVAVRNDRREVRVQRLVDVPVPADTAAPVISAVSIDNPTIWRSIPCGSEGGAACPGPRSATLSFTVSEPVKLTARLVNAAGATVYADTVWVDQGANAITVTAAHRFSDPSGWINRRLTPGTYRWLLDARDLAARKAPTSATTLTVTG